MDEHLHIEDPRNHSAEVVDRLRQLLAYGMARPRADAKRPHFFEIEDGSTIFYVHVSPLTGRVTFLAAWTREDASQEISSATAPMAISACAQPQAKGESLPPNC